MFKKFFNKNKNENQSIQKRIDNITKDEIPPHVAIIMDGNGRWAKKKSLPRIAGHHEGMKVVRKITKLASQLNVKYLTLYAFSTENWKRPKSEVDFLLKLPEQFLTTYLPELISENVKVTMIGEKKGLPNHTLRAIDKAMEETAENDGLILNFALNYGGRKEIILAMQRIVSEELSAEELTEDLFSSYLMTENMPNPDLLIRTSGEIRLSNFMLWQLAYAEFFFTDVLWPDFDENCFIDAIVEYQSRQRRFGGV